MLFRTNISFIKNIFESNYQMFLYNFVSVSYLNHFIFKTTHFTKSKDFYNIKA